MSSMECWLCGEQCEGRKALKNHLASKIHSRMKVICTFCPNESTSARINDLKKHIDKQHPGMDLLLPRDYYSESNGFWLACYPEDYVRVVKPSDKNGSTATLSRSQVDQWLRGVTKTTLSRTRAQWESGWRLADGAASSYLPTPARTPMANLAFSPPAKRMCVEEVAYSPTRPEMPEVEYRVVGVDLGVDCTVKIKSTTGQWFEVTLDRTVLESAQSLSAINRRMTVLGAQTPEQKPPGSYTKVQGDQFKKLSRQLSRVIGIDGKYVISILMTQVNFSVPGLGASRMLPNPFPTFEDTPCSDPRFSPRVDRDSELASEGCALGISVTPLVTSVGSAIGRPVTPVATSVSNTVSPLIPPPEVCAMDSTASSGSRNTDNISRTVTSANDSESGVSDGNVQARVLGEAIKTTASNPTRKNMSVTASDNTTTSQCYKQPIIATVCAPRKSNAKPDSTQPGNGLSVVPAVTTSMRDRAVRLLRWGAMPLFPPAKRDWADKQIVLKGRCKEFTWPPTNWQTWNGARRLTAWELAAMTLDADESGFPVLEHDMMLDSYNFLGLPGTSYPEIKHATGAERKMRTYNLKCLLEIAHTGKGSEALLQQYEMASVSRNTSLDKLITLVEAHDIKVRI